jgi:hypothetical protein
MTTPRDDETRNSDDETRADFPVVKDPNEPDASTTPAERRPPAFPSVGGDPAPKRDAGISSPFEPPVEHPLLLPAFASADEPGADLAAAPAGRNGRLRWIAALVATIAVLVLVAGVFVFFGARPATPSLVAQYAPANSAVFFELRLDLPGDQRDRLVSFMGKFPGFADPATFQQKIDDTLANALRATNTGLDWANDVEPWFGGEIGVFSSTLAPPVGTPPSFTVAFSVKDRQKLDELVNARLGASEMQPEDYKGQTIWSGSVSDESGRINVAVTDEALLVSTRSEDLKAALDVKADTVPGLADDPFFTGQLAALHADRLALFYYDYATLLDSLPFSTSGLPAECVSDIAAAAQFKAVGEVRAESDHLALNVRTQIPSGASFAATPNRRTTLMESMPSNTVAYAELRGVGAAIKSSVEQLLSCAGTSGGFDMSQLNAILGTAPQDYFDFVQDAGVAVTATTDGKFGFGLIATVDDENVARTRVERILTAIRLAAGFGGGMTIEEQEHAGATITVIHLGTGLLPGQELPTVAVTVANGRVYVGLDDFVTGALDRTAADSLASSTRLQAPISEVGSENAGVVYVDIAALRDMVENLMPAADRTRYETEIKPFVEPITHFVVVNRTENGINVSHAFLYVE